MAQRSGVLFNLFEGIEKCGSSIACWQSALALLPTAGFAQDNSQDLAKQLSNPVASLISVPFQFNYDEGFGPNDGEKADAQHPAGRADFAERRMER